MIGRKPNFFIVGAPKCGTTAMDECISQHPEVFMSGVKELHFFGSDLNIRDHRLGEQQYLSHFKSASDQKVIGESSVHYLLSERAPEEIRAYAPDAKILIMLRNPIDQMFSYYNHLRFSQQEVAPTFAEALALESKRRRGATVPKRARFDKVFCYTEVARYAPQVERYFKCFSRARCLIIFQEDFREQPTVEFRRLTSFLNVGDFTPRFDQKNTAKEAVVPLINRLAYFPPGVIKYPLRKLLPTETRRSIQRAVVSTFSRTPGSDRLDDALRSSLAEQLEPNVRQLEGLLECSMKRIWRDF